MGKPPRHEPDRGRWGPSIGFLLVAAGLVAGAIAGWWTSTSTTPSNAGGAASAPVAAASGPVQRVAAAPASAPSAPATRRIARMRDPNGDQTPDISDFINAGEKPTTNEVIDRLHRAGVHTGLGAFQPPGTRPPLVGLAVPEDFALPPGYVRHYQATDDGQRIEPILMFAPDYQARTPDGRPVPMPRDRVVPPELAQPVVKFGLFPLLLAYPAFRLHQHIAYGATFGEYLTFGLKAYLTAFALWWAAWAIGVVLCAAAIRAAIEAGAFAGVVTAPARATQARRTLERLGLAALYLGLPPWMAMRLLNG